MIIICGKNIREIEQNLEMVKMAMASGMPCGVGGATMADVEKALRMMEHMGLPTAISNPNYIPDAPECCPDCGSVVDYDPDTDTCDDCGRGYEEEEVDPLEELVTRLRENGLYTPAVDALLNTLSDFLNH
jgi:hypothetical protein